MFRSFNFGTVAASANATTLTLQYVRPLPALQFCNNLNMYVIDAEGTVHDTVVIPAKF